MKLILQKENPYIGYEPSNHDHDYDLQDCFVPCYLLLGNIKI